MALKSGVLLAAGLLAPTIATAQSAHDAESGETITLEAQADSSEWEQNEHFRKFYPLSVEMLGGGTDDVDVELYEKGPTHSFAHSPNRSVSIPMGWSIISRTFRARW